MPRLRPVCWASPNFCHEPLPRRITVNAVAPGLIETDMTAALNDDVRASYVESIPLKRMGVAQMWPRPWLFWLSDKAGYITDR